MMETKRSLMLKLTMLGTAALFTLAPAVHAAENATTAVTAFDSILLTASSKIGSLPEPLSLTVLGALFFIGATGLRRGDRKKGEPQPVFDSPTLETPSPISHSGALR
jgi:hypothetical protein